jgi:hypothetical protein
MPISNGNLSLSIDDILDYKSEIEILEFYFGINDLPVMICSPLRPDKSPSFKIDYNDNGNLSYYDFGGCNDHGSLIDLLMKYLNLSYQDMLERVYLDMIEGKSLSKVLRDKSTVKKTYKPKMEKLEIKVRPLREHDLEFWGKGGIDEYWLKFGDIYPISHIFITKESGTMTISCDRHAYAYVEFKDDLPTYKIYQPFSEKFKWLSGHDKSVWDLWTKLPKNGENLIITSSRKDALTIWANTGIPSTCLQAESLDFNSNVVDDIMERFNKVFLLYDNDYESSQNWGRINGQKLCQKYNFIQIEIPEEFNSKDSFELASKVGLNNFSKIIKKLIE